MFLRVIKGSKHRHKGGLALLKYKRDFNSRGRKEGEPLHSYLRISEWLTTDPPGVDELPEGTNAAQKKKNNDQIGVLVYYDVGKAEYVLCQFS